MDSVQPWSISTNSGGTAQDIDYTKNMRLLLQSTGGNFKSHKFEQAIFYAVCSRDWELCKTAQAE